MADLQGSDRARITSAEVLGDADPDERVALTLLVRREPGTAASDTDVEAVRAAMARRGFDVLRTHAASGRVQVAGRLGDLAQLFGAHVQRVRDAGVEHRHREGSLTVPDELDGVVTAVLGLDNRPQARPNFRVAAKPSESFTPVQLGSTYNFPADTDGTGQTIAIIELGGGYQQDDLDTYFAGLGLATPAVTALGVDGADYAPDNIPDGPDGEVALDIEVAGALAPAASIAVYFAPNTDQGFIDAVSDAVHADPTPTTMSISWGQSEDQWTQQARIALDNAIADGTTLGVTVCAAAGDRGSGDGATDGSNHVDFPASSPHVLGCGGTSLQGGTETVWNNGADGGATGGGISDVFAQPDWQSSIPATANGRGVPDVAADADPDTGYQVRVDGQDIVVGGTSAVAPLWAALIARFAQSLGQPLGLAQPALYPLQAAFKDITTGNNGAFDAGPGWDACTGLGSPDGTALLQALAGGGTDGGTGGDQGPGMA
jgi:kumamolisin